MPVERILVLRSRRTGIAKGMLLGSPKGRVIYRVVQVTKVRVAGDPRPPRLRLSCRRLTAWEIPEGAVVHPWPTDRQAPRKARPVPVRTPPEMTLQIAASRQVRRKARQREPHYGVDVGPTLRLQDILDASGQVIREADVSVATVHDPTQPKRMGRRAVRADPLVALQRAGTITGRELEAAETLRSYLEGMTPAMGQSNGMSVQTAAFLRKPVSHFALDACQIAREAAAALGWHWEAVLWVCLGGTVLGYSGYRRIRPTRASELVRVGMGKLADHLDEANICAA